MPNLKQVSCSIELGPNNTKLKEYGARYGDGSVECFIAVPEAELPFNIHMTTRGYIASGLAMFVFIDGQYQCNRNKRCPTLPGVSQALEDYKIEFRVRQKEEKTPDGKFIGREWCFTELNVAKANEAPTLNDKQQRNVGTIEVVALRCNYESQHLSSVQPVRSTHATPQSYHARTASAATQRTPSVRASTAPKQASSAGLGGMAGLFDGACDVEIDDTHYMNMDGAGDERPNHQQRPPSNTGAPWDPTYGFYMGSQSVAPAYDHDARVQRLTSANLNGQHDNNHMQWGIDDRSTVHKHYGNWRIETLPNTPENDQVPGGAYGLDGQGYRGQPNIIINQYTQHPEEPKEDPYLGQQGDARDEYKARLREQGHSVSGVSPLASRRHTSQRQGPQQGHANQHEQYARQQASGPNYRQGGPYMRQGQDHTYMAPQNFSRGHNGPPGGATTHNDPFRQLQALQEQTQELQRQLSMGQHGGTAHNATTAPHTYLHHGPQHPDYDPGRHQGLRHSSPSHEHPGVPPGSGFISPDYQRYLISAAGDQVLGFLQLDKVLLADAVPYVSILRTTPINKLGTSDWIQLKADIDGFITAGTFPDGTRIDRSRYRHTNGKGDGGATWPTPGKKIEWTDNNVPASWPAVDANEQEEANKKNNNGFWAASDQDQNNRGGNQYDEKRSKKSKKGGTWDITEQDHVQDAAGSWSARTRTRTGSRRQSSASVDHFANDINNNNNTNDNTWNRGNGNNQQGDETWENYQDNNDAGAWGNTGSQKSQEDDPWPKKPDDDPWTNKPAENPFAVKLDDDPWSKKPNDNGWGTGKSDHGGAGWDGTGNNYDTWGQANSPVQSTRQAPPARSEPAVSNASTVDPRGHIKPYWADWRGTTQETAKDARRPCEAPREVYNYPAPPKPTVPGNKPMAASHSVQAGKGADYVHKTFRPVYLDEMDMPYAVFTFKYRSKDRLEKITGRKIDKDCEKVTEEVERDQLLAMPKEKLVERFMKMKSPPGGPKAQPRTRSNSNAPQADNGWGDHSQAKSAGGRDNNSKRSDVRGSNDWGKTSNPAPIVRSERKQSNANRNDANNEWPKAPSKANTSNEKRNEAASNKPGWNDSKNNNNTGWTQTGAGNTGDRNKDSDRAKGANQSRRASSAKNDAASAGKHMTAWTNDPVLGRRVRDEDGYKGYGSIHGADSAGGGGNGSKAQQDWGGPPAPIAGAGFTPDTGGANDHAANIW